MLISLCTHHALFLKLICQFSMPTFQGGKHANNPIIFADQPVPDQRPSRRALSKTNILDVDYIPGSVHEKQVFIYVFD